RQELHEKIRVLSMEAGKNVKVNGKDNNLIELIKADKTFAAIHDKLDKILDASKFIGRAPSQTVEFITNEVDPILKKNSGVLGQKGDVKV
ncbi:MAG: adenylosuccinate lyase, partial [Clostridia bacterium]|nr:adenylosuccinate lyase [Clostridia bacterium]